MIRRFAVLAALVACLGLVSSTQAQTPDQPQPTLKVGDPAPPLVNGKYVKGEPVTQFDKGKVYVVEFWATWCGPCRQSIPHVSALQEKYQDKDVIFIGQDCWEQDQAQVAGFVEQMGDQMNYRVALDDTSDGSKGKMAETWMAAAGQNGIPCAFIIDRDTKIAWIGHPMTMDRALEQIVAGTFDLKKEAELAAKRDAADRKLDQALRSGDADRVLAVIDEVSAEVPDFSGPLGVLRFQVLLKKKDYAAAYQQAAKSGQEMNDNAETLNQIAWTIADEPGLEQRDLDLAMRLATRANELTRNQRGEIIDTLARIHFERGELDKAIELQSEAVTKAPKGMEQQLQATLDAYKAKKAAAK